ncbi:hypothetical protein CDAR_537111 [Caerostris darwini]|uniref:C2H2-type domain-containing protein n=1 Tax=Caerostris darwini TaxID=1538125 RepID=A0AAV4TWT9_9ARAC|nr:hypothetical protein CDAR_537111 [Caerostris darwini]
MIAFVRPNTYCFQQRREIGNAGRGKKVHECSICHYVAGRPSALKIHMMCHRGEKPYQCFRQRREIESVRKQKRVHECSICHYVAGCASALKIHMMYHRGEKPYECHHCGKCFTIKGNLKRHVISHMQFPTEERNRKCWKAEESAQVLHLSLCCWESKRIENPYNVSSWREALPVLSLWEKLHHQRRSQKAYYLSHAVNF